MSPKTLLIILVVIAVLVGAAIWRGQRDEGNPNTPENREHPPGESLFVFEWLNGGGDTLAMARFVGCNRSGHTLTFSRGCDATIRAGKPRQSRFVLKAFSNTVLACFGFTMKQLEDCDGRDDDEKGWVKPNGKSRFVVSQDEAYLRLYCRASNNNCTVTLE